MTETKFTPGPWIEHDGKGLPINRGYFAEIVWADGTTWAGCNNGQSASSEGLNFNQGYTGPLYRNSWVWDEPGSKIPVLKYRFRKPRGLQILESILSEVDAPVLEVKDR